MTVGGALILYATAVGLVGTAGFRRAVWPLRAPRLGAAAVLAAAWSVPVAFILAGVTIILPPSALFTDLGQLVGACLVRLHAAYGTPAGAGTVTAGQVLSLAMLARLVWAVGRVVRRRRAERRRHRLLVRLAGTHRPDVSAVVVDCAGPAAYSVGGRRPAVVVTSGAVDLLTGPQLGAVLAHERAHLNRRHHRWALAAVLVAEAMPLVPLLRETPARVGRLLEMDADERAADHHEPRVLASALVAVTSAGGHAIGALTGSEPRGGRVVHRRSGAVSSYGGVPSGGAVSSYGGVPSGGGGGALRADGRGAGPPDRLAAGTRGPSATPSTRGPSAAPGTPGTRGASATPGTPGTRGASATAGTRGPSPATTSAGADALARVQRILQPPDRLPRPREALARAAVVALAAAPLVLATAPAVLALVP